MSGGVHSALRPTHSFQCTWPGFSDRVYAGLPPMSSQSPHCSPHFSHFFAQVISAAHFFQPAIRFTSHGGQRNSFRPGALSSGGCKRATLIVARMNFASNCRRGKRPYDRGLARCCPLPRELSQPTIAAPVVFDMTRPMSSSAAIVVHFAHSSYPHALLLNGTRRNANRRGGLSRPLSIAISAVKPVPRGYPTSVNCPIPSVLGLKA